jgi:hypothetical protein
MLNLTRTRFRPRGSRPKSGPVLHLDLRRTLDCQVQRLETFVLDNAAGVERVLHGHFSVSLP